MHEQVTTTSPTEPREERFRLPEAQQFVTTWWIPDQYAGQTTASLHRLAAAVPRTGQPMTILTFSALHDNQRKIAQLRDRGALPPGVSLRNLFEDIRRWETEGMLLERLAARQVVSPAEDIGDPVVSTERGEYALREYSESGELVYSTMYRDDGSVLCRDYPVEVEGQKRRYQQFFHPDGSPSVLLGGTWELYFCWLDQLVGDRATMFVNESKSTARFMSRYENPNARVIHLFHESHLADSTDPFKGPLSVAHRRIIPHLDRFDATVFLTRKQLRDVTGRFGGGQRMHAVPNAGPPVQTGREPLFGGGRNRDAGIVVATLKPLKRLDHAIRGVVEARRLSDRPLTLDLYGRDAGSLAELERTVADTSSADHVRFRGYTPGAADRFAEASFSLMTSTTEGQSLVLLESMAAGCIPISYDIRYGPDELIVDGETGYLVEPGNVEALAETIARFVALPNRRIRALRNNARERLSAFSDDEVQARWAEVMRSAARAERVRVESLTVTECGFSPVASGFRVDARAELRLAHAGAELADLPLRASLFCTGRKSGTPWRAPLTVHPGALAGDRLAVTVEGTLEPGRVEVGERISDLHLEFDLAGSPAQQRLRDVATTRSGDAEVFSTGYGNASLRS